MSVFQGHIQQKQISGSFPPGPPPSPVRIGKTIFVSYLGNDLTGVREDVVFHFETLDAALGVAEIGDTIVLYPGAYTCSNAQGLSVVDYLTIFAHPGVLIEGTLFNTFKEGFQLQGSALLNPIGVQNISSETAFETTIFVECNSIYAIGGFEHYTGGSTIIKVKEDIIIADGSSVGIIFNNNGGQAHNVKLTARNIIFEFTIGGPYCIRASDLQEGSRIDIEAERIICVSNKFAVAYCTAANSDAMYFTFNIKADIYHLSSNTGVYCIRATENNIWLDPSFGYGFYFTGRLLAPNGATPIALIGGKLIVTGDIHSNSEGVCSCDLSSTSPFGEIDSTLYLFDGSATCLTTFVLYKTARCKVQFKNYKVKASNYLVDSNEVGSLYQVLSVYSTVDVNAAVVSNEIASTTAIIDPLIEF